MIILAVCFVVSITGIRIIDRIAKILIKDNPAAKLKIHTLDISKEYLQIFNFLYFLDSSFNCSNISLNNFLDASYIFNLYKDLFEKNLSISHLDFFHF